MAGIVSQWNRRIGGGTGDCVPARWFRAPGGDSGRDIVKEFTNGQNRTCPPLWPRRSPQRPTPPADRLHLGGSHVPGRTGSPWSDNPDVRKWYPTPERIFLATLSGGVRLPSCPLSYVGKAGTKEACRVFAWVPRGLRPGERQPTTRSTKGTEASLALGGPPCAPRHSSCDFCAFCGHPPTARPWRSTCPTGGVGSCPKDCRRFVFNIVRKGLYVLCPKPAKPEPKRRVEFSRGFPGAFAPGSAAGGRSHGRVVVSAFGGAQGRFVSHPSHSRDASKLDLFPDPVTRSAGAGFRASPTISSPFLCSFGLFRHWHGLLSSRSTSPHPES